MMGFGARLLDWFRSNARDLPWRHDRSPYTTWVSEVMLQQTTVDVVVARYGPFLSRFPDLRVLAEATADEVVAAWSGLGYYRRARGLHAGARAVMERFHGEVPRERGDLLGLPGVGDYTCAAIRSMAFNEPDPPIDGNVARVASRVYGDDGDVGSAATRRRLADRLQEEVPADQGAAFAEALIELGALVCRPKDPACGDCPVRSHCDARADGRVTELPVKKAQRRSVAVLSSRVLAERRGRVLLHSRPASASLLPGFLELPGRWGPEGEDPRVVAGEVLREIGFADFEVLEPLSRARHAITHHRIQAVAVKAVVRGSAPDGYAFHAWDELDRRRLTTETRKLLSGREATA